MIDQVFTNLLDAGHRFAVGFAICFATGLWVGSGTGCRAPETQPIEEVTSAGTGKENAFWNRYSGRFIHAPAFQITDSSDVDGSYRVTAVAGQRSDSITLLNPTQSLAFLWDRLPAGRVDLTYTAISPEGRRDTLATFETIKSPGFSAATSLAPSTDLAIAGMNGLRAVYFLPKVQHWLSHGRPDPAYQLWVHPSKLMGVLTQGMLFLSRHTDDQAIREGSKDVALTIASFLLTLREPDGAPLSGWTHSYWDGVDRGEHPIYMDQIMTLYPAEAAMAFLDLYDETGDTMWLSASTRIADTYVRTQREDGTWPLLAIRDTGAALNSKVLVPVSVIVFLDRLSNQYGLADYLPTRTAAFDWIIDNPTKTFAWDAQFEDTRPKAQYRNLSHREATGFARLLFDTSDDPEMISLARDLLRFVEDQFVVWSYEDHVTRTNWFKDGSKWNGTVAGGGKDWFLPAALEQYAFYTPIAGTTSNVIHAFCSAYDATGDATFRAKARALTRSLTDAQQYYGGGEIPTHLRRTLPEENWLNNSVYAARTLIDATCL